MVWAEWPFDGVAMSRPMQCGARSSILINDRRGWPELQSNTWGRSNSMRRGCAQYL